ncbi:MAG: hypothetical protein QM489_02260 [Candidatus Izemoplasma sp.]
MSKQTKKIVLAVISFLIPIVGIVLFFIYKPKKDAQLFGILGLLGFVFGGILFF